MFDLESFTILDAIDWLLMLAGGVIGILAIKRLVHGDKRKRDPLRGSPLRTNTLSLAWVWLALLAYYVSALIGDTIASYYTASGSIKDLTAWRGIITSNIHHVIIIAAVLAIVSKTFKAGMKGFGIGRQTFVRDITSAIPVLFVGLCACNLLGWAIAAIFHALSPHFQIPPHQVFSTLSASSTPLFIRINAIVGAVLLAPVGEELLFRGILQTGMHKIFPARHQSFYHRWAAIACVATVFGLLHMATPQHVPALIVLGVLLGYLYERTGSILAPIYLHIMFNSKSVLWFYWGG